MDFGSQVLTGEDVGDAAIKTTELAVAVVAGFAIGGFSSSSLRFCCRC